MCSIPFLSWRKCMEINVEEKHLEEQGHQCEDVGTYTKDSCDYPIFAHLAAEKVASGEVDFGILVCSSGEGIAIAAYTISIPSSCGNR